jgi:predicted transcriptional regulator
MQPIQLNLEATLLVAAGRLGKANLTQINTKLIQDGHGSRSEKRMLAALLDSGYLGTLMDYTEPYDNGNMTLTQEGKDKVNLLLTTLEYEVAGGYGLTALAKLRVLPSKVMVLLYLEHTHQPADYYDIADKLILPYADTKSVVSQLYKLEQIVVADPKDRHKARSRYTITEQGIARLRDWREWINTKILLRKT